MACGVVVGLWSCGCLVTFSPKIKQYIKVNLWLFFCLPASLASSLSDDLLAKATVEVVHNLRNKGTKSEMTRTNIQMIGALRWVSWCLFFLFNVYFFIFCVSYCQEVKIYFSDEFCNPGVSAGPLGTVLDPIFPTLSLFWSITAQVHQRMMRNFVSTACRYSYMSSFSFPFHFSVF